MRSQSRIVMKRASYHLCKLRWVSGVLALFRMYNTCCARMRPWSDHIGRRGTMYFASLSLGVYVRAILSYTHIVGQAIPILAMQSMTTWRLLRKSRAIALLLLCRPPKMIRRRTDLVHMEFSILYCGNYIRFYNIYLKISKNFFNEIILLITMRNNEFLDIFFF